MTKLSTVGLPAAERRQLTIMFCDLVGSTALAARLDPEDLRDLFTAYQTQASEIVKAAGGTIARYQGDGVLAYFGYPAASEDDAERAIGAGLELARGVETGGKAPEQLGIRVGMATGVVLVGDLLRSHVADSPPIIGEPANLAARLQELARPNSVVICDTTHRLAGALFEYRDLGLQRAKGLAEPLQAWQVVGRSKVASRFHALRSSRLPCVGRDAEIRLLLDHWAQARAGNGRAVVVSGDPGIGKSRLAFELVAKVRGETPVILRYDCSPQHQNSMLHPILEHLRRVSRSTPGDGAAALLGALRSFFQDRSEDTNAAIALIAELMALPVNMLGHQSDLDAQRKRGALFESIVVNLQRLASRQPVLILVEDAHWIDPTSRELMELFVSRMSQWPILLVVTSRPEFDPAWRGELHATKIELKPIERSDAEFLVKCVPGTGAFSDAVVRSIAERADGVPLFIEELTKAVVESGPEGRAGQVAPLVAPFIPSSLHASLTARLDRLGLTREVARVAAAIGREFTFDLLHASVPQYSADDLRDALQRLVQAELVSPSLLSVQGFAFRHALIQDAAYGMLPRDERKALHERIALALERRFSEIIAAQPEIAADHFTKAGHFEPAIRYRTEAGNRAVRGSALIDAAKHFSEAIALLRLLPPSPERDQAELKLQLLLGPVMTAIKGYASSEALEVFGRARELAGSSSTAAQQLEIQAGLFNVHYGRAELEQASAVAHQHFALTQESGLEAGRAYCYLGQIDLVRGNFASARTNFEQVLAIYREKPEDLRALGVYGSQHVVAQAFLAGVYSALGQPEKAAQSTASSLEYAHSSGHLVSIALALITRLLTPIPGGLKGDMAEAESALQFCVHHGLSNFAAWARFAQGAIMVRRGELSEGIDVMQSAVDAAENMGSRLFRPVQLATIASGYARLNKPEKALTLIDEAIVIANRTGEERVNSALHRLRGELLIALGNLKEGRCALVRAIEIAKAQQAVSEVERTEKTIARLVGSAATPSGRWRPLAALRWLFSA
jgi:class 3 adenylate cyclase/tetratricopeptide (TPR) repeat protein